MIVLAWSSVTMSNAWQDVLRVYVCLSMCVSVTDTVSGRRLRLRLLQRSMLDSLSMVESWRKVIPGLSMIKLTPHGVSQIRFCALDTVAAAYSTLSRIQSHLSRWHHCIAITVSERENASGQRGRKRFKAMLSLSPCIFVFFLPLVLRNISINRGACSYLGFSMGKFKISTLKWNLAAFSFSCLLYQYQFNCNLFNPKIHSDIL